MAVPLTEVYLVESKPIVLLADLRIELLGELMENVL